MIATVIALQQFLFIIINIFSFLSEPTAMHMLAEANNMGLWEGGEVVTKLTTLKVLLFPKIPSEG